MNDKEALQEIVFMVSNYVNTSNGTFPANFIAELVEFLEQEVVHCAINNNYK